MVQSYQGPLLIPINFGVERGLFSVLKGVINMNKENEVKKNGFEVVMPTPEDVKLLKGAVDLVNFFSSQGFMLPVTLENYTILASKGVVSVATDQYGQVVGTASYSQFYEGGVWEFGGWAVAKEYQKEGVGISVMKTLFRTKPHFKTIAFGNKNSGPIFEKLGAKVVTDFDSMPSGIFVPCLICPNKPAAGCCDTVYDLGPLVLKYFNPNPWNNNR